MTTFETIEIRCPECGITYPIRKDDLNDYKVSCMNNWYNEDGTKEYCKANYYQKYNLAKNMPFTNSFVHRCKGEA